MIAKAASIINESQSLVIMSGAGLGVDSGLPDFASDGGLID